jgi:hypothetical protein
MRYTIETYHRTKTHNPVEKNAIKNMPLTQNMKSNKIRLDHTVEKHLVELLDAVATREIYT